MPVTSDHEEKACAILCTFCGIASRNVPAHIVYEDHEFMAFLDINPIRPGHVQLIARAHYPYFDDLVPDLAARMMQLGQRLAKAMKGIHRVERVGFVFTGGDIAHVHAHLVPLVGRTDITSTAYIEQKDLRFIGAPRAGSEELTEQAQLLRTALVVQ
ncbi:HIT family protein [Advenella sp. S44]|uniref:HIT family protein n=1 Tax=Advenella sp. S44 TaxID=1982755 RepID=UPI000C2A2141|nr:HIT family protein [Advenella sp. S44]PJX25800.1 HIT family protein [Advenella sp. S44]